MPRPLAAVAAGLALVLGLGAALFYVRYLGSTHLVAAHGGTYTEGIVGLPEFLNPILAEDDNARDIDSLIFQGLTRTDPADVVHPVLAQSWETTDNQSYVFHLRQDVKWSDGKPFTADDVVFTLAVIQSATYTDPILSATWKPVTVTRVDAHTVKFDLKAPSSPFLVNTSLGIIPAHLFKSPDVNEIYGSPFNSQPVGTGPFRIAARDRSTLTLEPNPQSSQHPYLDHIVFRVYATGNSAMDALRRAEIDGLAGLNPAQAHALQQVAGLGLHHAQTFQHVELLMNQRSEIPYFQTLPVRQAVALAVDRDRIVSSALSGQGLRTDGPLPPSVWVYRKDLVRYDHDPARAAGLLDGAGWTLSPGAKTRAKGGQPLKVTVVASEATPYRAVAEAIVSDLRAVGFDARLQAVPTAKLVGDYLNPRTFQLALTAWDNGPDPDIFSIWHSSQEGPDGYNFSGMKEDIGLNKDLEDGQKADRAGRESAYRDAQVLLAQDVPAVWLYEPTYNFAVNLRVRGVRLDSAVEAPDRFAHVTEWYIDTRRVA